MIFQLYLYSLEISHNIIIQIIPKYLSRQWKKQTAERNSVAKRLHIFVNMYWVILIPNNNTLNSKYYLQKKDP